MADIISGPLIDDAVAQALQLDLCFLDGPGRTRHVPFTLTPAPIDDPTLLRLEETAPLLGRLTQAIAANCNLVQDIHAPLAPSDPFFAEILTTHEALHSQPGELLRLPLLLQRSDFLVDRHEGARLVECNSIAAGMAPFAEHTGRLHDYLQRRWPGELAPFRAPGESRAIANPAIDKMAQAIASACTQVARELDTAGPPAFLMVVQENEDNLFDQRLLEKRLRELAVVTHRRTFRQLHEQLSTGANQSLQLEGEGTIHVVYLRAGYQYRDYVARDLDSRRCCDALTNTRMFIERHRVAVNATVAQQLATSKRMQLHLARSGEPLLRQLGFDTQESRVLLASFTDMRQVDADSASQLRDENDISSWVLKNQGEGGGHCLFDEDILQTLDAMPAQNYQAWTLMRRLRPTGRAFPTLLVRDGRARRVERLVSEIGFFTGHLENRPLTDNSAIGYLVRSRPPQVAEGGVHSGSGALDSLVLETPGANRVPSGEGLGLK